jgi:hypothetical protein
VGKVAREKGERAMLVFRRSWLGKEEGGFPADWDILPSTRL